MTTVDDRAAALQLLDERGDVAAIAGPLHDRVGAADVDPADTGTQPEAGEAAAEELRVWAEDHGLPWLIRLSGRPGGYHVIVVLPEDLAGQWILLCQRTARHHRVGVTPRRTLRLLSSPHRLGLPAPTVAGTLAVDDLPEPSVTAATSADRDRAPGGRSRRRSRKRADRDRSRSEFGDACGRVRAGWGPGRAWMAANVPGSKAAEQGELDWRKLVWAPAVTLVAAEEGLNEAAAWQRFSKASPRWARQLGLDGWRETCWQPALAEARRDRPRRQRTDRAARAPRPAEEVEAEQHEIDLIRTGLRQAADQQIHLTGRRAQFARSLAAALDALAEAVVRRNGSISTRSWAEAARLDPKTIRAVRDFAAERGVLYCAAQYGGGAEDSAAWLPGPAAQHVIDGLRETSPTRWDTPPARTYGHADPDRQRRRFARDRQLWQLRCTLSTITEKTGETYAQSQHPAAKTLRSLWHQRRWWSSLAAEEQEQRRQHRRRMLGELHRTERSAWFTWLDRRWVISQSAERVQQGTAAALDHELLAHAPAIIHLGMRCPSWRTGGSAPNLPSLGIDPVQPELQAV